jgi:tRNA-2-methylthio-N6-dimethylallyladenosine synthase
MEDNVPEELKRRRLHRLNDLMSELSRISNEKLKGQTLEVLVDGESKNNPDMLSGRTRTNKLVHFAGSNDLSGTFVNIHITDAQTWLLKGEIVRKSEGVSINERQPQPSQS